MTKIEFDNQIARLRVIDVVKQESEFRMILSRLASPDAEGLDEDLLNLQEDAEKDRRKLVISTEGACDAYPK